MDTLTTLWTWITSGDLAGYVVALTSIVTAATALTALTSTTADDKFLGYILKVLNFLAGNFLRNTNADAGK